MAKDSFTEYVLDQLNGLSGVTARPMFGGHGLYRRGIFFAIIHKERLYFKTDEKTKAAYTEYGMKPFRPSKKQTLKNYYEVPEEILENPDDLQSWATRAIAVSSPARPK